MDPSEGRQSYPEGSTEDQHADSPKQSKSRSGPDFNSLSRCAACYNHKASSMRRWGDDGESSSSAEDSGPETDSESEAESTSSSNYAEHVVAEAPEEPETERHSPERGGAARPESGGEDGDGRQAPSASQGDEDQRKRMIGRAPLVKSFSLPTSLTPHLIPFSLLPRPPRVVSTLHLQVLSQRHNEDTFYTIRQRLSQREETISKDGGGGGGGGRINNLLFPQPFQFQQMGLPWQQGGSLPTLHQLSHQRQPPNQLPHQQQQPHFVSPLSAQGQRLPPPSPLTHTPMLASNAPPTHLHAIPPEPCRYCCRMQFPYSYWSPYRATPLFR